jgi:hypothetical protein
MSETITSAAVRDEVLYPAMDAVALAHQTGSLLHRPETPEVDSVTEVLAVLHGATHKLMGLIEQVAQTNGLQLQPLLQVTGWSDSVSADLHDAECNGDGPASGRQLAGHLAEMIDEIRDGDPITATMARVDLFLTFARTPRELLFRKTVLHHLRPVRARMLEELHREWQRRRAERSAQRVMAGA